MKNTRVPAYDIMKEIITTMPEDTPKHLIAFIYAACARIGEITRPDYTKAPDREGQKSICFSDFSLKTENGKPFVVLRILTSKRKSHSIERYVPINVQREKWLTDILANWLNKYQFMFPENTTGELFPFRANWGYKLIKKNLGFNPHFLRHIRATHYLNGSITGQPLPLEFVKKIGGWINISTLSNTYSGVEMQDVKAFI